MLFKSFFRVVVVSVLCVCWMAVASANGIGVGDDGTEVMEIQLELANRGFDVVPDGAYGPSTVEAVKAFQSARGLEADGMVTAATYEALLGKGMPEVSRGSSYLARRIVQTALEYIGVPYYFGGTTPDAFDCSGYIQYVYAQCGIGLPRTADVQYEVGMPISTRHLRAGDLVFFSTYEPGASHVGIYLKDGEFVHASSSRGVTISSLYEDYYSEVYIGARRVI